MNSRVALNGIIDLTTVDRDLLGCLDAQPHFIAAYFHDDNGDVIVDDDAFVLFPRQHQHDAILSWPCGAKEQAIRTSRWRS
jgi:hypothetical protein